jgi:transposase-like protein
MMFMTRSATMPKRRTFTAEFKSQLVLRVTPALRACASVSGEQSAAELCRQHQIKPQLLSEWKAVFLQNAPTVFQSDVRLQEAELRIAELERQAPDCQRTAAGRTPVRVPHRGAKSSDARSG